MPHTLTNLLFHIVFATKHRAPLLNEEVQLVLYPFVGGVLREHNGVLLSVGGIEDHLHLLAKVPAQISLSDMLQRIKGRSSKWLNEQRCLDQDPQFAWQRGYAAFSVSQSAAPAIARYIANQQKHHRQLSFDSEMGTLFRKHEMDEAWG